jgi:hypothetical protein
LIKNYILHHAISYIKDLRYANTTFSPSGIISIAQMLSNIKVYGIDEAANEIINIASQTLTTSEVESLSHALTELLALATTNEVEFRYEIDLPFDNLSNLLKNVNSKKREILNYLSNNYAGIDPISKMIRNKINGVNASTFIDSRANEILAISNALIDIIPNNGKNIINELNEINSKGRDGEDF